MKAHRRRIVSGSSKPHVFTVDDLVDGKLSKMKPGDELDKELYKNLIFEGHVYDADSRFLVANGCIRGYCLDKYDEDSDGGMHTYGETFDSRYVYLGFSTPLEELPYSELDYSPGSYAPRYDARIAAKKLDAAEKHWEEWVNSPISKYVDAEGNKIDGSIMTFDDLAEYYTLSRLDYSEYLNDPEILGYLRDYYAYMIWRDHGNSPLLDDDLHHYLLYFIDDLVSEPDPDNTEFFVEGYEDGDRPEMLEFLKRRAAIQRRYGVEPDWDGTISSSRKTNAPSKASKPRTATRKAAPRAVSKATKPRAKAPARKPAQKAKPKTVSKTSKPKSQTSKKTTSKTKGARR